MSPYFSNLDGTMNPESADLVSAGPPEPTEQDQQEQARREGRDRIGTGKTPAPASKDAPAGEAPPLPPGFPALATAAELEEFRAAFLADPYHPLHSNLALAEHYAQAVSRLSGHDGGEEVIGTLYPDGRLLRPEEHPPVKIPPLSEAAREAFALDPAEAEAVVEHQETLVGLADASGLPRYHVESLVQDVAAGMEALAGAPEIDSPEHGRAELARLEGGRAESIIRDAQALVQVLHESGNPNLIAAAEDLIDTSNHPGVLIGAARLYQELKNLPPQGPWAELLLGAGTKWAQQQSAAKARAAKAAKDDETPDDFVVSAGGRP